MSVSFIFYCSRYLSINAAQQSKKDDGPDAYMPIAHTNTNYGNNVLYLEGKLTIANQFSYKYIFCIAY